MVSLWRIWTFKNKYLKQNKKQNKCPRQSNKSMVIIYCMELSCFDSDGFSYDLCDSVFLLYCFPCNCYNKYAKYRYSLSFPVRPKQQSLKKNPATMRRYNSYQCLHKLEECGGGNCFNEIQDKYLCRHLFFQWGNLKGGGG